MLLTNWTTVARCCENGFEPATLCSWAVAPHRAGEKVRQIAQELRINCNLWTTVQIFYFCYVSKQWMTMPLKTSLRKGSPVIARWSVTQVSLELVQAASEASTIIQPALLMLIQSSRKPPLLERLVEPGARCYKRPRLMTLATFG